LSSEGAVTTTLPLCCSGRRCLVLDIAVAADVAGGRDVDVAREVGLSRSREAYAVATVAGADDLPRNDRLR